jgi:Ca2+/H+ antiporter, TMEM165/GDT1 family
LDGVIDRNAQGEGMLGVMPIDPVHVGPAVTAAFLGSLVEFAEALTIVLAVGTVRGFRPALLGAGTGMAVLVLLIVLAGPALTAIPVSWLQVTVGLLLLLFGLRWLRKAVLRGAGIIPLHDEMKAFAKESETMAAAAPPGTVRWWDTIAVAATFKAMLLEGLEVVFIVLAVGATGRMLVPASIGAAAAAILIMFAGLMLHRPLARVPENTLKWAVGILLSAFGAFWTGEGLGFRWPGEDLAILALAAVLLAGSVGAAMLLRR